MFNFGNEGTFGMKFVQQNNQVHLVLTEGFA